MSEKLTEVPSDGDTETETETATELYDVPIVARYTMTLQVEAESRDMALKKASHPRSTNMRQAINESDEWFREYVVDVEEMPQTDRDIETEHTE
jgi:acetolactate synthase small subunit